MRNFDSQKYYDSVRESAHGLASKFLSLLMQYIAFSVAALTAVGLVHERVHALMSIALSGLCILACVYFRLITGRYYHSARATIKLAMAIERDLFGEHARTSGVFNVIARDGGRFYTSRPIEVAIKALTVVPIVMFGIVLVVLGALSL
ncbi:MAG: hypothetical protein KDC95_09930 [Planctomycetes bacterium]|nr:hypothetical protein [Planctomycetota bacterium]